MKKLLIALLAVLPLAANADVDIFDVTNGVPRLLFSAPRVIDNITVHANSGTNTIVRFYDASTAKTNVVRAAYTSYSSYATNFSNVYTNEADLLVTNTFVGVYTAPTAVSAVTNSLPTVYSIAVPASTLVGKDVSIQTLRGLSANADQDCQLIITHRSPQ